jgi:hypothetical protein
MVLSETNLIHQVYFEHGTYDYDSTGIHIPPLLRSDAGSASLLEGGECNGTEPFTGTLAFQQGIRVHRTRKPRDERT